MPVATVKPRLTQVRAATICLLSLYGIPGYHLTLLEVQKLVYFLQAAGEPLGLHYVKARYGPYAETLHHVLQALEGHYLRGYGDRSKDAMLHLLPGAVEAADQILSRQPSTFEHLQRVAHLIVGFESPYGMELLSTIHWIAQESPRPLSVGELSNHIASWSERKARLFQPRHIAIAAQHLRSEGWINLAD